MNKLWIFLGLLLATSPALCVNFTENAFAQRTDGVPAAFGDFDSDELTDVFFLKDNFRTMQVYLGAETEPLLRPGPKCSFKKLEITSLVPGDFDGDAFMDIMFTVKLAHGSGHEQYLGVYINYGGASSLLNCTAESEEPLFVVRGEPIALDYNDDMIIDLFGLDSAGKRTFWLFNKDRKQPDVVQPLGFNKSYRLPHSHAYLDVNNDFMADLVIKAESGYEFWNGTERQDGFVFHEEIPFPAAAKHVGQSLFLDVELTGSLNHLVPVCYDDRCLNSSILIYSRTTGDFMSMGVNMKDDQKQWGFIAPGQEQWFANTITMRGGDYNMDGYPDLLATLAKPDGTICTFLLENVACTACPTGCSNGRTRTFTIRWHALYPFSQNTVIGAFYDFYQDGILDILMVDMTAENLYNTVAFRNGLDYDANFVKVIVLSGLMNSQNPETRTPLGRKKKTYGTNLPGPRIAYLTTTQDGEPQSGTSAQLPQSAYLALQLPYTVFGLGRTPNFVDTLTVGLGNRSRTWTQLIPNSQMIVVPRPLKQPDQWTAQLFVTPSKLIVMSTIALGGTCLVILCIILGLYFKEKREDRLERVQASHRFHYDAM